jgi:hypothetical protein
LIGSAMSKVRPTSMPWKLGGCHPDNRHWTALDCDGTADDIGDSGKALLPEGVADDHNRTTRSASCHVISRRNRAPEHWREAEG